MKLFFGYHDCDISNHEQVVICFRWINKKSLEANEKFLGLYQGLYQVQSATLLSVVAYIPITKIRGHGAAPLDMV